MDKKRVNILCNQDINLALNRHITHKLFESRILEHPQQALERTTFYSDLSILKDHKPLKVLKK